MKRLSLLTMIVIAAGSAGCASEGKFADQPKPDLTRDNGPAPPRGINNPEVAKLREKMKSGGKAGSN